MDHKCRGCGAALSDVMVDLGPQPLANSYVIPQNAHRGELFIPLTVYVCALCKLVQLHHEVPPSDIFSEYAYQSSWSDSWVEHARRYVDLATERLGLNEGSKVVEIASNDGYLLQWFVRKGIPVLGIEPAANIAAIAEERGIPSRVEFFERAVGRQVREESGPADLMVANNVLAHVHELHDFVGGFTELLAPNGRATIEFPHLLKLMEQVEFDTIYHEHFSYLSLLALEPVFAAEGLSVVDVDELSTHGGTLRVWLAHTGSAPESPNVERIRQAEAAAGLGDLATYTQFGATVAAHKREILRHLIDLVESGKRVAAYGARRILLGASFHAPSNSAERERAEDLLLRSDDSGAVGAAARAHGVRYLVVTPALLAGKGLELEQIEARRHLRRVHLTGRPGAEFVAIYEITS